MRKKRELRDLLVTEDRGESTARGLLSKLLSRILRDLGIGPNVHNTLMTKFLNDPNSGIPQNNRERNNWRGNFAKQITHPNMSPGVFLNALRVYRVFRFEISIKLWRVGKTEPTVHSIEVELGKLAETMDEHPVEQTGNVSSDHPTD